MTSKRTTAKPSAERKAAPIKTTLMELLEELTSLTRDDALVMAALGNIFSAYQVRFGRALAPARLVRTGTPTRSLRRGNLGKRSSAWA
jgi:hypothetical protein